MSSSKSSGSLASLHHHGARTIMVDHGDLKERTKRLPKSSKKSKCCEQGSSSSSHKTKTPLELDESSNAKKNKKKSRKQKSTRRTANTSSSSCCVELEDSMASITDSVSNISMSTELTMSSSLSRFRRNATSRMNRHEIDKTKTPLEVDESSNAKKNKKKSRKQKSTRRTANISSSSCCVELEDSRASITDSVSNISMSTELTMSSSLSRFRRNTTSRMNRHEMASILDGIRAHRKHIETNYQLCIEAVKMKVDADFEEQRQAILLKWKAMSIERKSKHCAAA